MAEIYKNLIHGEWTESETGKTFKNINPADTDEVVGIFQDSDENDAKKAIQSAKDAFGLWKEKSPGERGDILLKAADILESRVDEVAESMTREMGKTKPEAKGEVLRSVYIWRWFAGEGRRLIGETSPSDQNNTFIYTVKEPLGVVGIITPWNFPAAIAAWKLGPALVSGNTVVFKPATLAPLSPLKLVECLVEAGIPPGVINYVTGSGNVVGNEIINNPEVKAVSFTGSCEVGRKIYEEASKRIVKVQAEMGGKNPIIVLEDADLQEAVSCTIASAMLTTGQKCTACSRVIVVDEIAEKFTEMLIDEVKGYKVGNGLKSDVKIGPLVDENQLNNVLNYIEKGKNEGAEIIYGGSRLEGGIYEKGFFVEPTIFINVKSDMVIAQEEIFGPVLAVIKVKDFDEAIKIANDVEFGLSASIFTNDLNKTFEYARKIECGIVKVNGSTAGIEFHVPFGGYKSSSSGIREQGRVAVDFYTQIKTVYIHY